MVQSYSCSLSEPFTNENSFADDSALRLKKVNACNNVLFSPTDFHLRLIRIRNDKPPLTVVGNEIDFSECLAKTSQDCFRILSFCQAFSLDPLQCTESAMMRVLQSWSIAAMFLDVLLKFGDQPQVFDESSGFVQSYRQPNGSFELCYQFMYVEPSGRPSPRDPWSFRQTGVEHRYEGNTKRDYIILLHPKTKSTAQERLEGHARSSSRFALASHPLNVHLVILSSYLVHWADHIESLAETLSEIRKHVLVIDTNESTFEAKELQKLRNLEDKIVCKACRCLRSTKTILETLQKLNDSLPKQEPEFAAQSASVAQHLQLLQDRIDAHINSADILALRVQATLGLLTNLLDLQNQTNSNRISGRMLHLTRESVDDNVTVKVITLCTLIYLPASFMATFFGMNFFEFQGDAGTIRMSPHFWVYIAATVPLTILTVGVWYTVKCRHDRNRKKAQREGEV